MRRAALLLALAAALAGCGHGTPPAGYHVYKIPSSSMEPTFHCARPGAGCLGAREDKVLVAPVETLHRGDVIAFHTPPRAASTCGEGGTFLKRVIGLPGDTVTYDGASLRVNGKRLAEPYVSSSLSGGQTGAWTVPPARFFLLGDARNQSCDSRVFGPVTRAEVIGKVVKVIRPK